MDSKVLNEHLKGVANAIRAKEGSSDPINPQDFSTRIANLSSGSGSGELEGEYFLAKPNGRYWKFTFMPEKSTKLRIEDFEQLQIETMYRVYDLLLNFQNVYGAAACSDDLYAPEEHVRLDGFYEVGYWMTQAFNSIWLYTNGFDYDKSNFNRGFLRVWRECDIKRNSPVEYNGLLLNSGLIEVMKEAARITTGMEITDDEAILLIEQSFMLVPATEEEYKTARMEI